LLSAWVSTGTLAEYIEMVMGVSNWWGGFALASAIRVCRGDDSVPLS